MATSLVAALEAFSSPHDEKQLQALEEAIAVARPEEFKQPEFRALLGVFERFPEDDGYGVFWSIVHCLEACKGYEAILVESVSRAPSEFNLLMVNRLLNAGITEVDGEELASLLASVATNPNAPSRARQSAQRFVAHQHAQRHTDA